MPSHQGYLKNRGVSVLCVGWCECAQCEHKGTVMPGAARQRLPNRRSAETWDLEACGLHFRATVGRYNDGRIGEIFPSNTRVNSSAGVMASDAAVVASVALQYGVPLDVIRRALMRDSHGRPSGPLGVVIDLIAKENGDVR